MFLNLFFSLEQLQTKQQITSLVKHVACLLKLTGRCAVSVCVLDTPAGAEGHWSAASDATRSSASNCL